jgi:hypothetical protein
MQGEIGWLQESIAKAICQTGLVSDIWRISSVIGKKSRSPSDAPISGLADDPANVAPDTGVKVTILRQSRRLSVAGPSKEPDRNRSKAAQRAASAGLAAGVYVFIVQNDRAWVLSKSRRRHSRSGRDWPDLWGLWTSFHRELCGQQ